MVGVWGMGGIGKTTLMKHIQEHAEEVNLFDKVAMAVVSQLPNLKEIQTKIAEDLGYKFQGENIGSRAKELYSKLNQGNNLVLLDDLWEELDLHVLGIPYGDASLGCKVVITTRILEVCNRMNVQAEIAIQALSEQESWELFERTIGNYDSDACHEVAKKVVTECKGLPLAIVVLAKCLRKKSYDIWVNAADQLTSSSFADMTEVFKIVNYSYDKLETEERKLCFLFFCLFPEDTQIDIEYLLKYVVGENIFRGAVTLGDIRCRFKAEVDKLISSCLLLKGEDDSYVMVHDIVRDVGIWIASKENSGFLIKAGKGISQWPVESTRACLRMSLMKNVISNLEGAPECPQLLLLTLADNMSLSISDDFFAGMKRLVTLDLSGTDIPILPQAVSCLGNHLRTLHMSKCHCLYDISGIGSLSLLEVLDLSDCDLKRLPEDMKFLTKLKFLNLSRNKWLQVIPPYVISSLILLEEFYMYQSFSHWKIEGEANRDNASFSELLLLHRLSILHVGTNQDSLVHMDYPYKLKNLSKFTITHGSRWFGGCKDSKTLTIKVNDHKLVNEWVKALWEVSDELALVDSDTMKGIFIDGDASLSKLKALKVVRCSLIYLSSELMVNLQNLKTIDIICCKKLKAINSEGDVRQLKVMCTNLESILISQGDSVEVLFNFKGLREEPSHANILAKLRKINLIFLDFLEKIWMGFVSFEHIRNLIEVTVQNCPKLSYLFPISMAKSLQQLEILVIDKCYEMVEIFGWEKEEVNEIRSDVKPSRITALLPRLKTLSIIATKLSNLDITFPCLETLKIWGCDRLEELFHSDGLKEDNSATLQFSSAKISLWLLPKLTAIWKGFIPNRNFQNLKEVEVWECKSLSCIFPFYAVMSLQQLEILKIIRCQEMVNIFGSDEEEKEERETVEIVDEIVDTHCCMIQKFGIRRSRRDLEPSPIGDNNDGQPLVNKAVLPRLKILRLHFLEKFIGFCQQSSVVFYFPSLEELLIKECADLKRLPFDSNSTPKLKEFNASRSWFYRLQWDDKGTEASLLSIGKTLEGRVWCDCCRKDLFKEIFVICVECHNFDLCIECFSVGAEVKSHKGNHLYRVVEFLSGALISPEWSADEETLLLKGIELHGLVNWAEVATHVGTKSVVECIDHYPTAKLKVGQSVDPTLARPHK